MKQFLQFIYIPASIVILFVFGLMNCARESRPTGGPIDTIAPVVVREKPHNNATHTNPSKITVVFNEKIQLNSIDETCLISPVFETKPTITARKKKLIISLKNQTLRNNTTYTFNFSKAIKDVHEGTFIEQYVYAFSTGGELDSLKIQGSVRIAETDEIPKNCYVLLYTHTPEFSDSTLYNTVPTYTTKVSEQGNFLFSNIQQGTYVLYALVDEDKNFRYSQANEFVAFLDTLVVPSARIVYDTIRYSIAQESDSSLLVQQPEDTIVDVHSPKFFGRNSNTDSVAVAEKDTFRIETRTEFYPDSVSLKLFVNQIHTQSIRARSRVSPFLYALGFSLPFDVNSLHINSNQYNSQAYSFEALPSRDSVLIWLRDTALIHADSTQLFFNHAQKGVKYTDTIILMKNKEMPARLEFSSSQKSAHTVFPSDTITVHANRPLATMHTHAQVFAVTDTLALQDYYGNFIDTANLENIYARQIPLPKKRFVPKYFYASQEIIDRRLGNGRFALYFSKPFDTSEVSLRLAEYPDLQNWYRAEVDSETNALLCWITDERAAVLKNPIITVTYRDAEVNKEQRISFSTVFEQTERYRNHRPPRLMPIVREEQKKELYVHTAIEVICNNPIQEFSDSLFLLYDASDSLLQNCITKIERSSSSPRTIHIFHTAEVGKNYILTLQKNAVYDVYGDGNKEFSTTIATQKISQTTQYVPVPCEYNLHENNRTYTVTANWKPNTKYKLILPYAAAEDVYGAVSDSLCIDITCPKSDSYGSLVIDVDSLDLQQEYVFELRKKGAAKTEVITLVYRYPEPIVFANLPADEYTLSCIIDMNANGTWDTGSLEEKRQPETRLFFPKKIQIKANWENRINWNIQK